MSKALTNRTNWTNSFGKTFSLGPVCAYPVSFPFYFRKTKVYEKDWSNWSIHSLLPGWDGFHDCLPLVGKALEIVSAAPIDAIFSLDSDVRKLSLDFP